MAKGQPHDFQSESVTHSSGDISKPPDLRFLHYNDVYHIEPGSAEPVGGVARFQSICNYYRSDEKFKADPRLITLFSGDAFNPSLESSITKGSHMVPFLNQIGTDVACVGNHDLDFGVPRFRDLAAKCKFPWLLANVLDPALGEGIPLGNAKETVLLTASNGLKIGIIGLVEREWLDTINSLPPSLIYKSASATAIELVPALREQGADMVIAISHQREPNDNKLAEKTPHGLIDIILGGHDHYYEHKILNGTHVLRSGTDFRQLSYIEARRNSEGSGWDFHIVRRNVLSSVSPDEDTVKLTEKLTSTLKSRLEKPLGFTAAPLDARFLTVRRKESNMGNFVCDLMRSFYSGDCCIVAAGTFRGDQIYPPGILQVKDIMNCFPFEDPCVVIGVTGKALVDALENSVSNYPALEGRFPQVSNIEFEFDPRKAPGSRVLWTKIGEEPVQLGRKYRLVTRDYMARGKDGFTSLMYKHEGGHAEEIVSEENGILLSMLLRQYFMSLKVLGKWNLWGSELDSCWKGIQQDVHRTHTCHEPHPSSDAEAQNPNSKDAQGNGDQDDVLYDSDSDSPDVKEDNTRRYLDDKQHQLAKKVVRKWWRLTGLKGQPKICSHIEAGELKVDWTRVSKKSWHMRYRRSSTNVYRQLLRVSKDELKWLGRIRYIFLNVGQTEIVI